VTFTFSRNTFRHVFTTAFLGTFLLSSLTTCARSPSPAADFETASTVVPVKATEPQAFSSEIENPRLAGLGEAAKQEIAAGHLAGAVILVGHKDRIIYRKAFGHKALLPAPQAMTADTIFDLASLTKVVATTTAILQLAEHGQLALDSAAAAYWPAFAQNGKGNITLRQLLTHTSGLRAEVNSKARWSDYPGALQAIAGDRPVETPGTGFRYSDVNFIVLGEIVRRVSGLPLDDYCARNIFQPLGLKDTSFKPPVSERSRIAPSDLRWGEVQDPTAYRMGGVAGNAGLFSTADDLAVLARMLLDGGERGGQQILTRASVAALSEAHTLPGGSTVRGLGWDLRSPYSKEHTAWFPKGSFGHTGYTGTSLWIDPKSETFLIVLSSRLHPDGKGNVKPLRAKAAAAVAAAIAMGPPAEASASASANPEPVMPGSGQADGVERVQTGLDALAAAGFAPLSGKHIGIITNHTGIDAAGNSIIQLLHQSPNVKLRAIFSPEHGLTGQLDEKIATGRDSATGLPVYSLYGNTKRPTAEMLEGLDALVYDIQDVGARFYTYITTMAYAMEAAAAAGLDFYVMDRPNPINAAIVQGPVMDSTLKSFTGYFPLPVRYGMTAGELAGLFNSENHIGAKLHVIKMQGYRRESWFDETGLPWTNSSPNIRSLTQATLYPGVGMVEAANLSVGRGTETPFEVVGAPWISGDKLAEYLSQRNIPGVAFDSVTFVPHADRYRSQRCEGVRLRLTDRALFDGPMLGVELAAALHRIYPGTFELDRTRGMFGAPEVLDAVKKGQDPQDIRRQWQASLDRFRLLRAKYLLY
jgi:uncharacterized protein YbbC (DUF1343 family)/CubicO group peptidase (beta-lactamase class C family)